MPDKVILIIEKVDPPVIEITITKKDGSSVILGDEYKDEYLLGRSAFAKYLNDNTKRQ